MEWLSENLFGLISLLFGAGGIGFAVISKILDRKKYEQEVRTASAEADMKGDDFWKKRYDVLQKEVENKDTAKHRQNKTLFDERNDRLIDVSKGYENNQ